ncbi:MAG: diguanylate cyclase [Acidimicrobiales bacterium]|nr:diguanylate cyclase [Acidimicrobiales bacterium]
MEARSALLVISVENADAIADAAGPAVAKQLAADVCTAIGPHLRQTDLAAPISDDRVGVVMTELPPTDDQSLIEIADRMLHAIDQIRTSRGPQPVLRIGIAPAEAGILTHDLLQRAQQALEHGRVNQMRRAVAPITTSV